MLKCYPFAHDEILLRRSKQNWETQKTFRYLVNLFKSWGERKLLQFIDNALQRNLKCYGRLCEREGITILRSFKTYEQELQ